MLIFKLCLDCSLCNFQIADKMIEVNRQGGIVVFKDFFLVMLAPYSAPFVGLMRLNRILPFKKSDFLGRSLIILFLIGIFSGIVNNDWQSTLASFLLLLYKSFYDAMNNAFKENGFAIEKAFLVLWRFSIIPVIFGVLEKMASYFYEMSVYQVLFYSHSFVQENGLYRIYSTFGNPNIAGTWFACLLVIGIALYVNRVVKGPAAMFLLVANLQCLMWTGSKGAVIAMLGTLLLSFWAYKTPRRRVFIAIVLLCIYFLSQGDSSSAVAHVANPRDHIWVTTMKIAVDHLLLGVGVIGGIDYIGEVHAHNLWFSMLLFNGIPGLLVVIGMQLFIVKELFVLWKRKHPFFPMLFGITLVLGIHSAVDFTIMSPQGSLLFILFAAAIASAKQLVEQPDWSPDKSPYGDKNLRINFLASLKGKSSL